MVLSFFIIQHERYFVILKKKNILLYPHISSAILRRCDVPRLAATTSTVYFAIVIITLFKRSVSDG